MNITHQNPLEKINVVSYKISPTTSSFAKQKLMRISRLQNLLTAGHFSSAVNGQRQKVNMTSSCIVWEAFVNRNSSIKERSQVK